MFGICICRDPHEHVGKLIGVTRFLGLIRHTREMNTASRTTNFLISKSLITKKEVDG